MHDATPALPNRMVTIACSACLAVAVLLANPADNALAQSAPAVAAAAPSAGAAPATPPPPYSLPWQLRPVVAVNVVRSDTSIALYDAKDAAGDTQTGATVASMLLFSYKLTPSLAPMARLALVQDSPPDLAMAPPSGSAFVNPILGLSYAGTGGRIKWAGFGGVTLPIGMGGGDSPDPAEAAAAGKGIAARSAMDNAMFAVNYFTMIGGAGAAYLAHKATVQVEATVLQLIRARGPDTQDSSRTNLTLGLHLGYSFLPLVSAGAELRYQRWLSDAAPVRMNDAARDTVTFAVGPRFHFKVGTNWFRPGISYSRGLDAPLSKSHYQMVQVDVPFVF